MSFKNDVNKFDDLINEFEGKVVYVDIWATWCAPCVKSIPDTKKAPVARCFLFNLPSGSALGALDVGIVFGRDDDAVVAQAIHAVLDVEGRLQEVKLLVLVDDLLGEPVGVERLALEGEDRLGLHVARGREGAGRRVALDDEERALLGAHVLVPEVEAAVAQLFVV